jgi:cytochrome c oxidase assembly protein Cox11
VTAPPNRFVIAALVFLVLYMTIFYAIVPLYEMAVGR